MPLLKQLLAESEHGLATNLAVTDYCLIRVWYLRFFLVSLH
jgi:hypothetical protein